MKWLIFQKDHKNKLLEETQSRIIINKLGLNM